MKSIFIIILDIYSAGECLPLLEPFGWREQDTDVKLESVEEDVPQYLQLYFDFLVPSYN